MKNNKKINENTNQDSEPNREGIHISGSFNIVIIQDGVINFGGVSPELFPRAEGGGQINNAVDTNANQGGQNAIDHSESENSQSQFADGNGRSGIAGSDNDEMGGQQGIKIRDSEIENSKIKSASAQLEENEEGSEEEAVFSAQIDEQEIE